MEDKNIVKGKNEGGAPKRTKRSNPNAQYAVIALCVLLVLGAVAFAVYNNQNNKRFQALEDINMELMTELDARDSLVGHRDSVINDWIAAFNEIEDDLAYIKNQENVLTLKADDPEIGESQRDKIIEDIQLVNKLLDDNKKRIASLQAKLKKSGIQVAGLEKKIEELALSLEERNQNIAVLKEQLVEKDFQLAQLNQRVDKLSTELTDQLNVINQQHEDINRAYLAYGSYKELKDKGLLTKEGGFLWIGQSKSLSENFSDSSFMVIDIEETKTIPVNSKDAQLITEHPEGSYKFVRENDEVAYLEIEDPNEFWKISKYMVVETKK